MQNPYQPTKPVLLQDLGNPRASYYRFAKFRKLVIGLIG